jgi:hypothetical protein
LLTGGELVIFGILHHGGRMMVMMEKWLDLFVWGGERVFFAITHCLIFSFWRDGGWRGILYLHSQQNFPLFLFFSLVVCSLALSSRSLTHPLFTIAHHCCCIMAISLLTLDRCRSITQDILLLFGLPIFVTLPNHQARMIRRVIYENISAADLGEAVTTVSDNGLVGVVHEIVLMVRDHVKSDLYGIHSTNS